MEGSDRSASWLAFAREDLLVARLVFREGIWNQACFHSQQAAEKLLKAFLEARRGRVPKLHSLAELVTLCSENEPRAEDLREVCLLLDRFYITTRYPVALVGSLPHGMPSASDAREALTCADAVRYWVEEKLGSPVGRG